MRFSLALWVLIAVLAPSGVPAGELETALAKIRQIGPQASGAAEAMTAWKTLSESDASGIPSLLAAIDDENLLAANYIRSAIEAIAEREGDNLPAGDLQNFVIEIKHSPRARRLAYELLARVDSQSAEELLSDMLHDPSVELRREAVGWQMNQKHKLQKGQIASLRRAFAAAVDDDQVKEITKRLKDLGEEVDVARHYGFVMKWHIVGPFDNNDEQGYDKPHGPEGEAVALSDVFEGSHDVGEVKWQEVISEDDYGRVDLNKALGKHKFAICYAAATFDSAETRPIELRWKSKNAGKVWLNGKLVDERKVYHADGGPNMDQYVCQGDLKRGANTILVKICQNDQQESWAQEWAFQLRVCDAVGAAVLAKNRGTENEKYE